MESIDQSNEIRSAVPEDAISLSGLTQAYNISKEHCYINKAQTILEILTSGYTLTKPTTAKESDEIISRLASKCVVSINEPTSIYQIESISFDKNPNNTVIKHEKISYTLLQYYSSIHNIAIKFKTQPLLIAKLLSKKKQCKQVYLLPEVSYMVTLDVNNIFHRSSKGKKISDKIEEDNNNEEVIKVDDNNNNDNENCNCNVKLHQVLNKYIDINVSEKDKDNDQLSQNLREINEYLNQKKEIQSMLRKNQWLIFYDSRTEYKAKNIKHKLLQAGRNLRINVEEPIMYGMRYRPDQTNFSQSLCDEIEVIVKKDEYYFNMILIILPSKDSYTHIKKFCIEKLGIMTQILIAKKMREVNQYYESVLIQMYQKTGNDVFRIQFNKEESRIMICGITLRESLIDTNKENNTNDTDNQEHGISLSITSSYTDCYSKYHFEHITDDKYNSLEEKLGKILSNCIENYFEMNHSYPSSYLIYLQKSSFSKNSKFEYNIIGQVSTMLQNYFALVEFDKKKAQYSIVEVDHIKKEVLKPNEFCLMKNNSKICTNYCLLENYSHLSLSKIYNVTLKLTYYNWIKICSIPSCLRYSQKGSKMFQTCKLNSVHEKIKNEAFYL